MKTRQATKTHQDDKTRQGNTTSQHMMADSPLPESSPIPTKVHRSPKFVLLPEENSVFCCETTSKLVYHPTMPTKKTPSLASYKTEVVGARFRHTFSSTMGCFSKPNPANGAQWEPTKRQLEPNEGPMELWWGPVELRRILRRPNGFKYGISKP